MKTNFKGNGWTAILLATGCVFLWPVLAGATVHVPQLQLQDVTTERAAAAASDDVTVHWTTTPTTDGSYHVSMKNLIFACTCLGAGLLTAGLLSVFIYFKRQKGKQLKQHCDLSDFHQKGLEYANPTLFVLDGSQERIKDTSRYSTDNDQLEPEIIVINDEGKPQSADITLPQGNPNCTLPGSYPYSNGNIHPIRKTIAPIPVIQNDEEIEKPILQGSNKNNTFVNTFSGVVGSEGAELTCQDSDISVTIPKGAIPQGEKHIVDIAVSFDFATYAADIFKEHCSDIWLTPIVQCKVDGLPSFKTPITIKIPHRVNMSAHKKFNIKLHHSQKQLKHCRTAWSTISSITKHIYHDVAYHHDQHYFTVATKHPGVFLLTGHGKKGVTPLKLCTVVYGNIKKSGPLQGHFRLYICDVIKDSCKRIELAETSRYHGYSQKLCGLLPLSMPTGADFTVRLTNTDDPTWNWTLNNGYPIKTYPLQFCNQASTAMPNVQFVCSPKHNHLDLETLQAGFKVVQKSPNDSAAATNIKVFLAIKKQSATTSPLDHVPTDDEAWDMISLLHCRGMNARDLATALGLSTASIEDILGCVTDMGKIKRTIDTWRIIYGQRATITKLCSSLEQAEFYTMADLIQNRQTFVDVPL